jgi:hypothetical protein
MKPQPIVQLSTSNILFLSAADKGGIQPIRGLYTDLEMEAEKAVSHTRPCKVLFSIEHILAGEMPGMQCVLVQPGRCLAALK